MHPMANPIQIADAKISLAATSAIAELRAEADVIHRRAAAKQMLRSGNTITEVKDRCIYTLKELGEVGDNARNFCAPEIF